MADIVAAAVRTPGSLTSIRSADQLALARALEGHREQNFFQQTWWRHSSTTVASLTTAFSLEQVCFSI